MIAQQAGAAAHRFTGRDARRAVIAFVLMTVGLTAILAIDIAPSQGALAVGDVAVGDIRAPRTTSYESAILTAEAVQQARLGVEPQYDFTAAQANALASQQALGLGRLVAPVDAAFAAAIGEEERQALLQTVIPELSDASRSVLVGVLLERWAAIRDEAGRVLDSLLRSELRDTQVADVRASLAGRMGGDLDEGERALAAELIAPLVVPNSSFSRQLTSQAEDRAAAERDESLDTENRIPPGTG